VERDYQKDLEICERATDSVWFHAVDNDNECCHIRDAFHNYIAEVASYDDAVFFALARTALPWYIKRCMELESQLHQAEEREVRYREALEKAYEILKIHGKYETALWCKMARATQEEVQDALSSPSQPSRYREALAVVKIVKKIGLHLSRHHGKECNCLYCQLYDTLAAYDKAGEEEK
jgi:hypothetical protein